MDNEQWKDRTWGQCLFEAEEGYSRDVPLSALRVLEAEQGGSYAETTMDRAMEVLGFHFGYAVRMAKYHVIDCGRYGYTVDFDSEELGRRVIFRFERGSEGAQPNA